MKIQGLQYESDGNPTWVSIGIGGTDLSPQWALTGWNLAAAHSTIEAEARRGPLQPRGGVLLLPPRPGADGEVKVAQSANVHVVFTSI